ncbi:MAG: hypothetical protein AMXMBFR48_03150 [Ignavibacteriales bacterium]
MAIRKRTIAFSVFIIVSLLLNGQENPYSKVMLDFENLRLKLNIPGISFAVMQNRKLLISEGLGYDDMILQSPMTDSTPVHIASITKTFAAFVIGKLQKEGIISVSDPVAKYELDLGQGVRVEHLLSHTSLGEPGSRYYYNNSRYNKLDTVMYQSTNRMFASHLAEKITRKIPLRNTFPNPYDSSDFRLFTGEPSAQYINRLYTGYVHDSTNVPVKAPLEKSFAASAGLFSTAKDLVKYADFLLNDTEANYIFSQLTEVRCSPDGKTLPYALGWFVEYIDSIKFVWHYGYMGTNSSLLIIVPEKNLAFSVIANSNNLSRVYPLEEGTVLASEPALLFIKYFLTGLYGGAFKDFTILEKMSGNSDEFYEINKLLNYSLYRLKFYRGEGADSAYLASFRKNSVPNALSVLQATANNSQITQSFTVDSASRVWFISSAEEYFGELTDYGYCTDSTGKLVWSAKESEALPGGGNAKNLYCISETIYLMPGKYTLHYITDDSHSPQFWSSLPPDDLFWGVYVLPAK